MSGPNFDPNTWYYMTESRVGWPSALQNVGQVSLMAAFSALNSANGNGLWQFKTIDSSSNPPIYAIRNKAQGPMKQLGTCYVAKEVANGNTQPCVLPATGDNTQHWTISTWPDNQSQIKIVNVANGTAYNLDCHPGNPLFMGLADTSVQQPAQRWMYSSAAAINDGAYSTLYVPNRPSPSIRTSQTPTNPQTTAINTAPSASPDSSNPTLSSQPNAQTTDIGVGNGSGGSNGSNGDNGNDGGNGSNTGSADISIASSLDASGAAINTASHSSAAGVTGGADHASSSNSSNSTGAHGLSTGTGIAIGVGVGVGFMALLLACVFFLIRRRRSRLSRESNATGRFEMPSAAAAPASLATSASGLVYMYNNGHILGELSGKQDDTSAPKELHAGCERTPVELPSDTYPIGKSRGSALLKTPSVLSKASTMVSTSAFSDHSREKRPAHELYQSQYQNERSQRQSPDSYNGSSLYDDRSGR